jgi:hypothetical protein
VKARPRTHSAIFEVSDRYIEDCAALDPMLASFWGISGYDHQITDYSPDGWAARLDLQRAALRRLDDVTPTAPVIESRSTSCASASSRVRPHRIGRVPPLAHRHEQPSRVHP